MLESDCSCFMSSSSSSYRRHRYSSSVRGTGLTEIKKLPFVTIQKYQKAPSVKLGIGQNIVLHGSPTVNFFVFFSFVSSSHETQRDSGRDEQIGVFADAGLHGLCLV